MPRIRDEVLQQVWRHAHAAGARQALSNGQLAELRKFASARMREMPHTVVDGAKGEEMRASFVDALDHAARDISDGIIPK